MTGAENEVYPQNMKILPTGIEGLVLLESPVHRDERGCFLELFNARDMAAAGIPGPFVQDNLSVSARGTLRGLHFQRPPHAQGKLVRVLRGAVFDVAVDLRSGSPTRGRCFGVELSAENARALYIPAGFAHGFLVTSDEADFFYKCTDFYRPEAEGGLAWDDPTLAVRWPTLDVPYRLSPKDASAPRWDPKK